jgi:hypothetical protein
MWGVEVMVSGEEQGVVVMKGADRHESEAVGTFEAPYILNFTIYASVFGTAVTDTKRVNCVSCMYLDLRARRRIYLDTQNHAPGAGPMNILLKISQT